MQKEFSHSQYYSPEHPQEGIFNGMEKAYRKRENMLTSFLFLLVMKADLGHKYLNVSVFVREGNGGRDGRPSGISFKMCKWRMSFSL